MYKLLKYIVFFLLFIILAIGCARKPLQDLSDPDIAVDPIVSYWKVSDIKSDSFPCPSNRVVPNVYRLAELDTSKFFSQLRQSTGLSDTITIGLLQWDGKSQRVRLARSASVPLVFESKYGITAFSGRLDDSNGSLVRLEVDSQGLRYMITSIHGTSLLVKLCNDLYLLYDKKALPEGSKSDFE